MTPHLEYRYGIAYTEWNCTCGNIEGMKQTGMSTKTTYTGGGASDRTVDRETDEGIWVKESHGDNVMKTLYQCHGAEPLPNYSNCDEGYCGMEKLAEYETAEEEGRLVILPCKIGTIVYVIRQSWNGWNIDKKKFSYAMIGKVGKTVFLTSEEAEKALEGLK